MAQIIFTPDPHRCRKELDGLGAVPTDTVAECSCGRTYVMREDQRDGQYWSQVPSVPKSPKRA